MITAIMDRTSRVLLMVVELAKSRFYGRKESQWCLSPVSADIAYSILERLIQDYQTGMNTPLAFIRQQWLGLFTSLLR